MSSPDEAGKKRFFEAGAELLGEDPFRLFEGGLPPDVVARRAERSRRTFYDHFGSKSGFVRELLVAMLDEPAPDPVTLETRFNDLVADLDGDFVELLHNMSQWVYTESTDPVTAPLRFIAFALGRHDASVREALIARAEIRDAPIRVFSKRSVTAWGMALRPPWTPQRLAIIVRALADGLYMRSELGEPDASVELLTLAVLSLAPSLMQPGEGISDTIDDIIRSHAADASRVWRETHRPRLVANARSTVLDTLEIQLERHGYHHTQMADVAAASGISTTTIIRAFGDIDALITMAVEDHLPFLESEVDLGLAAGDPPIAVADRHIDRLVRMVGQNRVLFRSMLAMSFGANDQSRTTALVGRLSQPLERCLVADGSPGPDLAAETVTQTIIGLSTVHRTDDEVATIARGTLRGISVR